MENEIFIPTNGELIDRDSGHLFVFDDDSVERAKLILRATSKIMPDGALRNLIETFAYWGDDHSQNYLLGKDVADRLSTNSNTLNKRIARMVEEGLIYFVKIDRSKCPSIHPRVNAIRFIPKSRITDLVKSMESKKELLKQNRQIEKRNNLTVSVLNKLNLPKEAMVDPSQIKFGLTVKGGFQFEQVAAPRGYRDKVHATSYKQGSKDVFVITESMANVYTVEDVQTLCALITLTINQWANIADYLHAKQEYPENLLYVELIQLIRILGKPANEYGYGEVRDSMNRLIETVVKSQNGASLFRDALALDDGDENFTQDTFQFFDRNKTTLYSKLQSEISYNEQGRIGSIDFKAHAYKLVWNQDLYKRFLTDEFFFNVPIKIFSARPYVFLLYMMLRSNFYSKNKFSKEDITALEYTAHDLHKKIGHGADVRSFRRALMTELKAFDKNYKESKTEKGDTVCSFDLEGITISATHTSDSIYAVICVIDPHKMLKACGILSNEDGMVIDSPSVKAAPQSKNPMLNFQSIIELKSTMGDALPQELNLRLVKNKFKIRPKKEGCKIYYEHPENNGRLYFCHYSSDDDILTYSQLITQDELVRAECFKTLKKQIAMLPMLSVGQDPALYLEKNSFLEIMENLFLKADIIVEAMDLYDTLENAAHLRSLVISKWQNIEIRDSLISNIAKQIIENKTMKENMTRDMFSV